MRKLLFVVVLFLSLVGSRECSGRLSSEDEANSFVVYSDEEYGGSGEANTSKSPTMSIEEDFLVVRGPSPANEHWNLVDRQGGNVGVDSFHSEDGLPLPAGNTEAIETHIRQHQDQTNVEGSFSAMEPVEEESGLDDEDNLESSQQSLSDREVGADIPEANKQEDTNPAIESRLSSQDGWSPASSLNTPSVAGSQNEENILSSGVSYQIVADFEPRSHRQKSEHNSETDDSNDQRISLDPKPEGHQESSSADHEERLLSSTEAVASASNLLADTENQSEQQYQDEIVANGHPEVNLIAQGLANRLDLDQSEGKSQGDDSQTTDDSHPIFGSSLSGKRSFKFPGLSLFSPDKAPKPPSPNRFPSTGNLFPKPVSQDRPRWTWSTPERELSEVDPRSPLDPSSPSFLSYLPSEEESSRPAARRYSRDQGRLFRGIFESDFGFPDVQGSESEYSKKATPNDRIEELKNRAIKFFTTARYKRNPLSLHPRHMDPFAQDAMLLIPGSDQHQPTALPIVTQPQQMSSMSRDGDHPTVLLHGDQFSDGVPYRNPQPTEHDIDSLLSTVASIEQSPPITPQTKSLLRTKSLPKFFKIN